MQQNTMGPTDTLYMQTEAPVQGGAERGHPPDVPRLSCPSALLWVVQSGPPHPETPGPSSCPAPMHLL